MMHDQAFDCAEVLRQDDVTALGIIGMKKVPKGKLGKPGGIRSRGTASLYPPKSLALLGLIAFVSHPNSPVFGLTQVRKGWVFLLVALLGL